MRGLSVGVVIVVLLFSGALRGQDRTERESVLLFVDDLHIDFVSTPVLRSQLRQVVDRLLDSGRAVGLATDAPPAQWLQPTDDRASLGRVIRLVTGGGLKRSVLLNPTPNVAADVTRRGVVTQKALLNSVTTARPQALIYITEAQTMPSGAWMPTAVANPRNIEAAVLRLQQFRDAPSGIQGVVTVTR